MVFGFFVCTHTRFLIINKHYNVLHYLLVSVLSKSTFQFCEEHYDLLALEFFAWILKPMKCLQNLLVHLKSYCHLFLAMPSQHWSLKT